MNPSIPARHEPSGRRQGKGKKETRVRKPGTKRIFPREETAANSRAVSTDESESLKNARIKLDPEGNEIQVHSVRMRSAVDTFLMNTSTVHTKFRALLQGTDGGFQGEMDGIVIGRIVDDLCFAALAITQGNCWLLHSRNDPALTALLDAIPRKFSPASIEGESKIIRSTIEHPRFKGKKPRKFRECIQLLASSNGLPHGPGGHHRLAQESDIPRLEEYANEFEKEVRFRPPSDWESLINDKAIMLGVIEGTVASVAIRSSRTIDQVLIEGIFTFPSFRRRGLAGRLVSALTHQASGKHQSATAIIPKNNLPMLSLLEKLRFTETAEYLVAVYHQ